MDRTVVLPEFPNPGASEPSIAPRLAGWCRDQVGKAGVAVVRDGGPGAFEGAHAKEFVADELEVGRVQERKEIFEKGVDVSRPASAMIAAAGLRAKAIAVFEPSRSERVEARSAYTEQVCGAESVQQARVEIFEGSTDKLRWEAMAELFLFKNR